jgi:D-alanyl-D-alanine carboxypeptidase/D-alanyl-D-alanine-endopeptidase (penicillin-binding protein 4)
MQFSYFHLSKAVMMKHLPLAIFIAVIAFGCSPARQIQKTAERSVLQVPALATAYVGISIYDAAANKYLYSYNADKYFVPASNTKLATCYAAMKYLGDSLPGIRYSVSGNEVHVQPTGDPTFLHPDFKAHPVYSFLAHYSTVVMEKPLFTEAFLGKGWSWDDYTEAYMAQRSSFPIYGNVARLQWMSSDSVQVRPEAFAANTSLQSPLVTGFEVKKPWDENRFVLVNGTNKQQEVPFTPLPSAIEKLLTDTLHHLVQSRQSDGVRYPDVLYSQPTDSLLKIMMHRSDNFFAEQALLMVSNQVAGEMNDAKGVNELLSGGLKDLPQKPRWVDGSGLSRYNLFSPKDLVAILDKMRQQFSLERLKEILPTGHEGTLTNYYKEAQGFIFGKTGTLSGVVAFSGFLYTKKDKLLIFSILVNNHQTSSTTVRRAVEQFLLNVREQY